LNLAHFRYSQSRENALSPCFSAIPDRKPLRTLPGIARCQPCGTRPPGAGGRNAGKLLDRSADVSGWIGQLFGARDPIVFADEAYGIDFEGEIAVITGDIPLNPSRRKAQGARRKAQDAIRLIVLVNDISLRHVIAGEIAKGFGFLQGKPSSTLSPVGTDLTCAG